MKTEIKCLIRSILPIILIVLNFWLLQAPVAVVELPWKTEQLVTHHAPLAILHVGPHKMASSSTQAFLFKHQKLLRSDNFRTITNLPGPFTSGDIKNTANLAFCLRAEGNRPPLFTHVCNQTIAMFKRFATNSTRLGHNIVLSSEELDLPDTDMDAMGQLLQGFDVRVVVFYRHLYEYLPSLYNEIHKKVMATERPGVVKWFQVDRLSEWEKHFSNNTYNIYNTSKGLRFPAVSVVNMHDVSQSPVENFLCNHMGGAASKTCAQVRSNREVATAVFNARESLHGSVVVKEAVTAGYLKKWTDLSSGQRSIILDKVDAYLEKHQQQAHSNNNPMVCASDAFLQQVLQHSIEYERQLLPSWHDENVLRQDFESQRSLFCEPDGKAIIKQLTDEKRTELFAL